MGCIIVYLLNRIKALAEAVVTVFFITGAIKCIFVCINGIFYYNLFFL